MKNNKSFCQLITFFILFLLNDFVSFSQTVNVIKPLPILNKKFLVVVHILLDSSKTPAINDSYVRNSVASVSTLFSPIGVSFEVCDVRYINNYSYFELNSNSSNELFVKYGLPNRLNLFVVGSIANSLFSNCGLASTGGVRQNLNAGVVIASNCSNELTLAHELGHFFGLEHTFETSHGADLVESPDCNALGDGICDTPADPYFPGAVLKDFIKDCTFIYAQKDPKGNYYNADVGNIMSYYGSCVCEKFTLGQYRKMADTYLSNPILW